jgi:hypothetical protein
MKQLLILVFITISILDNVTAQRGNYEANELVGEFGVTVGAAHYFGDLNTRAHLNRPKIALGAFYRKQFNNYLGMRLGIHYAQLGYSDIYSENDFQKRRNLSFNTDIWEFALSGDFNFFKFVPGDVRYPFTPYVTFGLGVFSYNPYAYLNNKKVFLRPLGTEGQNINYQGIDGKTRKPYGSMALCIPIGFGIKYNVSEKVNISFEITQRLTATDYLDDVSTTYVGVDKFPTLPNGDLTNAGLLQDRSYEKGVSIGTEGTQRGWSKQKDQYVIGEIGFTFNISTYKCPANISSYY